MMSQSSVDPRKYLPYPVWGLVLLALYVTSLYSYLLFHSLAEIFSIIIAVGVFAIAWNARRFLDNNYLLFLGVAYLFVALIDLVHTLSYKGMGVFPGYGANLPTQLWIAARYLEAASLLAAPLFLKRRLHPAQVFAAYFVVFVALLLLIFLGIFPVCFVEGAGLTTFKRLSEYLICFILAGALGLLWRHRREFDPGVLRLLSWSIVLTIASELAFTFYLGVYDLSNLLGHMLKILSFYLIYQALIQTALMNPFDLLFRNLKLSEEALRKERDFVDSLIKTAQAIVLVVDPQGKIIRFNPYLEQLSGRRLEEVQGQDWITTFLPARERSQFGQVFAKSLAGAAGELVNTSPILTRDGRERVIEWYNRPLMDARGNLAGLLAIGHDITERQRAEMEVRQLNLQLEKKIGEVSQRTAELEAAYGELESFSYTVSHDLRAPLRGISGFCQALEEDCGQSLGPQGLDYLGKVKACARQLEGLIEALLQLSYTTRAEMRRGRVDLSALAAAIAAALQSSAPERRGEFIIAPGLEAEGDPTMLLLVLENLLGNAWKFTAKGDRARIEFRAGPQPDGSRVFLVRDNGAGFDMQYVHKLFGAFQRLHNASEYPGSGVGLATVQRLIQRHGGRVWAEGSPGRGATFYFTLEPGENAPGNPPAPSPTKK
jgi:hypothetical protein